MNVAPKVLLFGGGLIFIAWLLLRSNDAKADTGTDDAAKREPTRITPPIDVGKDPSLLTGGTPPLATGAIALAPPSTGQPGSTPSNPLPSLSAYIGFKGFVVVETGDAPLKLCKRVGCTHNELLAWNEWARSLCPKWVKTAYNNGNDTIAFFKRYGKTAGLDCVVPGYKSLNFYPKSNGAWPVLEIR